MVNSTKARRPFHRTTRVVQSNSYATRHQILIDEFSQESSLVCQGKLTSRIDRTTDKVSSSPVRKCLYPPVSQAYYPSVTDTLPPLPCRPGSQSQMDFHTVIKGSPMERNHPLYCTWTISNMSHRRTLLRSLRNTLQ
jgi:hypothetical protein